MANRGDKKRAESINMIGDLVRKWAPQVVSETRRTLARQYTAGANELEASGALLGFMTEATEITGEQETVVRRVIQDLELVTRSLLHQAWPAMREVSVGFNPTDPHSSDLQFKVYLTI